MLIKIHGFISTTNLRSPQRVFQFNVTYTTKVKDIETSYMNLDIKRMPKKWNFCVRQLWDNCKNR